MDFEEIKKELESISEEETKYKKSQREVIIWLMSTVIVLGMKKIIDLKEVKEVYKVLKDKDFLKELEKMVKE